MTAILYALIALVIGAILYFARKGGADAVKASANKEALDDVVKANAPATPAELDRVRKSFRRP